MRRVSLSFLKSLGGFLDRTSACITLLFDKTSGLDDPLPPNPPRIHDIETCDKSPQDSAALRAAEAQGHRSCSWRMTMSLLMAEFIGAAAMGIPAAFAEMGLVLALSMMVFIGLTYCYTSHIIWRFCLRHKEVRDVCDIGRLIFGRYGKFGYWFTVVLFVSNNVSVMGVHVQLCGELLNALMNGYKISFSPEMVGCSMGAFLCFILSLPPSLSFHAKWSFFAVICTIIGIFVIIVSAGLQHCTTKSSEDLIDGPPAISAWPKPIANLQSVMVAFLNMAFAFIGQITFPSFIADMERPQDFPKALYCSMSVQYSIFALFALTVSAFIGGQYIESPAVNSLFGMRKPLASGTLVPTVIILGSLYASLTARFVMFRIFDKDLKHITQNTVKGWATRIVLLLIFWAVAWVISQGIPSFSTLLAIVGAIFAAIFGYIYWGVAWFWMQNADLRQAGRAWDHRGNILGISINVFLIVAGVGLFLVTGTWASIDEMIGIPASKPFSY